MAIGARWPLAELAPGMKGFRFVGISRKRAAGEAGRGCAPTIHNPKYKERIHSAMPISVGLRAVPGWAGEVRHGGHRVADPAPGRI